MVSFASSLRQLLCRGQPATGSVPDSITCFDGNSDDTFHPQHMLHSTTLQQGELSSPAIAKRPIVPLSYDGERPQHCAAEQGGDDRSDMQDIMQVYQDSTLQMSPHTTSAQARGNLLRRPHVDESLYASQTPEHSAHPGTEVRVRQDPAKHEDNDRDVFAEFTNEGFYDETDVQTTASTQGDPAREPDPSNHTAHIVPSMKKEPGLERQLFSDTADVSTIYSPVMASRSTIATPGNMAEQTRAASTGSPGTLYLDNGSSTSRLKSEPNQTTSRFPPGPVSHTDSFQQQHSSKQHVQPPKQSVTDSIRPSGKHAEIRPSPGGPVLDDVQCTSVNDPSSLECMALTAKARLLESQWRARHQLPDMRPLDTELVQTQAFPFHGSRPNQELCAQQCPQASPTALPPAVHPTNHVQRMDSMQRSSDFPCKFNIQDPNYSMSAPQTNIAPRWVPSSLAPASLMQQTSLPGFLPTKTSPPQGFTSRNHTIEAQRNKTLGASHETQSLATSAYHPPSSSPKVPGVQMSTNSKTGAEQILSAIELKIPRTTQNSVIEFSDDDDDETAESFSWKLPDFEVTYHPPTTDKELPMAKVSILGNPENLVRSEVALTEDHAHQEMELLLNVFLPAQQTLQTPDPQPAHAVLNFHTISVMVLETFVQYEIGDEMGRGYGFHGGNIGEQALRPISSASDEEPTRTRSAKDADVDEIFFAVLDRWRAGLLSGKATLKLIRGCQEFCDIALDVIHYVKEHGLTEPEPKKRRERSDKGVKRGPQGGKKEPETKGQAAGKRKADAVEQCKVSAKRSKKAGAINTLQSRKKAKVEDRKKTKPKVKPSGITVIKRSE